MARRNIRGEPPARPYGDRKKGLAAVAADEVTFHGVAGLFGPEFQGGPGGDVAAAGFAGHQFKILAPDGADAVFFGVRDDVVGADKGAGAAADADVRFFFKGCGHLFVRGAKGHADGADADDVPAGADAQTAEDAEFLGVGGFEPGLGDAVLGGQFLDKLSFGSASQEQFQNHPAGLQDFFGMGLDRQTFFGRIGAGVNQSGAGPIADFHQTEAAIAFGFQIRVITEGGNIYIELPGGVQNGFAHRHFDVETVDKKTDFPHDKLQC